MDFKNKIFLGDNIEVMKSLPDKSFDFCFADPPYYLQIQPNKKLYRVEGTEFDGCQDDWDKFDSMEQYKQFTIKWLTEIRRLLKDDGTICVISGMQSIYEIGSILRDLGFWIINDIIWKKSNPTPNFGGTRLNNSHETILWASKSKKSKFTFNYKTGKHLNGNKQMGSIWEFPVCSGKERLKDGSGNKLHTTQKPEALLYRMLVLFTKKNDLVIDPFGGTMTTAAVAKLTGRNYTMIEREKKYFDYGVKRVKSVVPQLSDIENGNFDVKPLKVSMKEMIQNGYFKLGEIFQHKNGQQAKLATDDGKLTYHNQTASMHEIAAHMMNKSRRVNAFDFLYVKRKQKWISINEVREQYRAKISLEKKC